MNRPTRRRGHLHSHTRRFTGGLWPYVAGTIITVAVIGGILRLSSFWLESARPDLEQWLTATLRHPVMIDSLKVRWQRWTPELLMHRVALQNPDSGETALHFADIRIRLGLWSSIIRLRPSPSRLIVEGGGFSLSRDQQGRIQVKGIKARGDLDLAAIFFTPDRIEVRSGEMLWHDQMLGAPPVQLSDVSVSIRNVGDRHQLEGKATLPGESERRIRFALDLTGDPFSSDWKGYTYLSTRALPLPSLPFEELHPRLKVLAGEADMEMWGTWEDAQLTAAHTRFRLAGVHASFETHAMPLRWARGAVSFRRQGDDWQLAVDQLELATNRGRWAHSGAEITVTGSGPSRRIGGRVRYVDLGDVVPAALAIAPLDPALRDWLQGARPAGQAKDLAFLYRPDHPTKDRIILQARLDDVALEPHADRPGLQGLAGTLQVGTSGGRFRFDSSALVAHVPRALKGPTKAIAVLGELSWRRTEKGWRASLEHLQMANLDGHVRITGSLNWEQGEPSPFIDIRARFGDGNLEGLPEYLPVHAMPERLSSWLSRAFPTGAITDGGLVLRGRAADFPFDRAEGRFEVRFNLSGATLDYSPRWPRVEEADAEVVFSGRSLNAYSTAGKVFDADLLEVHAHIPDLQRRPAVLKLNGKMRSSGRDGLRLLLETPLKRRFEDKLGDAVISGGIVVGLGLEMTLSRKPKLERIEGTVRFDDNDLTAERVGLELTDLRGTLDFTRNGLNGEGLTAHVWEIPVELSVADATVNGESVTRFVAEGQIGTDRLLQEPEQSPVPSDGIRRLFRGQLRGTSTWRASLNVPKATGQAGASSTLVLESDLRGLTVDLPAPLAKTPEQPRPLRLTVVLGIDQHRDIRLSYGDDLRATLRLIRRNGVNKLIRGAVYLGTARGELPDADGLFVYAELERFSSTDWLDALYRRGTDETTHQATSSEAGISLHQVEIKARQFELVGHKMSNLHLRAFRGQLGTWFAHLQGDELDGTVNVPTAASGEPVTIDLERLSLKVPGPGQSTSSTQGPLELPPVHFECADFSFGDLALGSLSIVTRPQAGGLRVEQLRMVGDSYELDASGDWWFTEGEPMSHFKIHVTSPDQGSLLKSFGYEKVMKGGAAEIIIDANWRGSPGDFSLARINGFVYYRADNGRVADLEPGAGRIFGLLSIHALPRRLRLDFDDTFKDGFSYDRVEGNFTVYEGNAYTNDLYVRAPAARIDIAGRVGLANQDYDQLVTVTPEVSSTFAIGGALAGGPIGAAAALFAQQIFKLQIERTVERQYRVSGSWLDPQVVRLETSSQGFDEDEAES